jgi:hypothetical protein
LFGPPLYSLRDRVLLLSWLPLLTGLPLLHGPLLLEDLLLLLQELLLLGERLLLRGLLLLLLGNLLLLLLGLFLFLLLTVRLRYGPLASDSAHSGARASSDGGADKCPRRPAYGRPRRRSRDCSTQSTRPCAGSLPGSGLDFLTRLLTLLLALLPRLLFVRVLGVNGHACHSDTNGHSNCACFQHDVSSRRRLTGTDEQ